MFVCGKRFNISFLVEKYFAKVTLKPINLMYKLKENCIFKNFNRSFFDWIVFSVWTIILLFGQLGLNRQSTKLQLLAVIWMWAGILLIRKTSCLPYILMSLPVFMCEIQRPWAWSQVVMVLVFLLRILIENRFSRKEVLTLAGIVGVTFFFSWPIDASSRWVELRSYSSEDIFWQWFHPQASWAIFAFRQTADRILIVVVAAMVIMRGSYLSTHRIMFAMSYVSIMSLIAGFGAQLLPWQDGPHLFLGTTNFASWRRFLFHGAGYNLHYVVFMLVIGFPWLWHPLCVNRFGWVKGFIGLCIPIFWIRQRALALALISMAMIRIFFLYFSGRKRTGTFSVIDFKARNFVFSKKRTLFVFLISFMISLLWLLNMGVLNPASELNRQFKRIYFGIQYVDGEIEFSSPVEAVVQRTAREGRRPVWRYALTHVKSNYWLRGGGAGTWSPFHRENRVDIGTFPSFWAHTHNTFIDVYFEYGIIPSTLAIVFFVCGIYAVAKGMVHGGRMWLPYFAGMFMLALGQHLLYAFTTLCGLLPAFILTGRGFRVLVTKKRSSVARPVSQEPSQA